MSIWVHRAIVRQSCFFPLPEPTPQWALNVSHSFCCLYCLLLRGCRLASSMLACMPYLSVLCEMPHAHVYAQKHFGDLQLRIGKPADKKSDKAHVFNYQQAVQKRLTASAASAETLQLCVTSVFAQVL